VGTGKTPVLGGHEWRQQLDAIPTEAARGLRDRALIATLSYYFAQTGAGLKMKVGDLRPKGARCDGSSGRTRKAASVRSCPAVTP
jgi:hypothetical protein